LTGQHSSNDPGQQIGRSAGEKQFRIGGTLVQANKFPAAIEAFQRATEISPENAEYHLALAEALHKQHRFREAAISFARTLKIQPKSVAGHIGLGVVLHKLGELESAIAVYRRAIELNPDSAQAHTNLGVAYQDKGDFMAAAEAQRQAIVLEPFMASAHNNLGVVLSKLGLTGDALTCFLKTISLKPDHSGAHFNIGYAYQNLGYLELAEKYYRQALTYKPHSETLRFYLAVLHLMKGDFSSGWREYEFRWGSRHQRADRRKFPQPQWKGEPLNGDAIFLYAEQGLGDTMQFVRYAPMVAALGGKVVLEVQPPLRRLLNSLPGVQQVISRGERIPDSQWQCPLMSLPLAFRTEVATVPAPVPYLFADQSQASQWASQLATSDFKVGLVWGGNPKHQRERERSIPLKTLMALSSVKGAKFYSLQKGAASEQVKHLPPDTPLVDLDSHQRDFADTAAIVANLDLVISIDTSVAHLAGGMGKPVWVLLHHGCDWRWFQKRIDSPWYPTARLFRKSPIEEWEDVVERMSSELTKLVEARPPRRPTSEK
jgi:tetratricopeptide (TPR) repeat protein